MSRTSLLQPTGYKLVFLVEWACFVVWVLVRKHPFTAATAWNLVWPFAALYLAGCLLVAASGRSQAAGGNRRVYAYAVGLAALDQALKSAVAAGLALGESVALIDGFLGIAHVRNPSAWVAHQLQLALPPMILLAVSLLVLVGAPLVYRFYSSEYRSSFWSRVAFVLLCAAGASAAIEYGVRGFVLDYIDLPGVLVCDLKDLFSMLGAAAFVVEAFDNPEIPRHWRGWTTEGRQLVELGVRFARFTVGEWRGLGRRP